MSEDIESERVVEVVQIESSDPMLSCTHAPATEHSPVRSTLTVPPKQNYTIKITEQVLEILNKTNCLR